eukprot:3341368-Alexandrium_andersonii.AAC.1
MAKTTCARLRTMLPGSPAKCAPRHPWSFLALFSTTYFCWWFRSLAQILAQDLRRTSHHHLELREWYGS